MLFLIYCILCAVLVVDASASVLDDQPYCALRYRRLCQGKGRHVACQYPHPGPGISCQNYTQIKFTAKLRHFIVSYINRRRQRIAAGVERVRGGALVPKPRIMMMVVWDRELALLAQRLADQCSFIHDDCRATVRYPYSGQTVGEVRWRGSSGESDAMSAQRAITRVFDAWWGERRRVQPQQLIAPFRVGPKGSSWGHFSQLAVWTLAAAGCGAARHGNPRRLLLVCDFSHTNMLGQSTLEPGELVPCPAHCTRKSRSAYPLLCAPIHVSDKTEIEDETEDGSYEDVSKFSDVQDDTISTVKIGKIKLTHGNQYGPYRSMYENATKLLILHKLDQELNSKSPIQYISSQYRKKSSREHFGDIRKNHEENLDSEENLKAKHYSHSIEFTTEVHRKWKHTRQRPRRPGADALMSKPAEKISEYSSMASLHLDKEDMEQLFRDTGFHEHWKEKSLP